MRCTDRDIWAGWAYCAVDSNTRYMPIYAARACHPDCDDPMFSWSMLVGLQRERQALLTGERLPKEVVGLSSASMDQAIQYLEQQMNFWTDELAFGSYRDDWNKTVVSDHVDG